MITKPFRDYNSYLREQFGCRVQKITLDAGLTCPNRDGTLDTRGCIYCNERGSGSGASRKALGITRQIEEGKAYLGRRYKAGKFLAYFQSFSNTYAPLPVLRRLYEEALSDPDVVGLSIGTRPDCASDEVLDYLASVAASHMVWIEYGLQSANDATLARIRRGHDVAAFTDAVARTKRRGIPVCVHVILGLPASAWRTCSGRPVSLLLKAWTGSKSICSTWSAERPSKNGTPPAATSVFLVRNTQPPSGSSWHCSPPT